MKRAISAYTKSPHQVNLDGQGRTLVLKPRPKTTYRAARRNAGKKVRREVAE